MGSFQEALAGRSLEQGGFQVGRDPIQQILVVDDQLQHRAEHPSEWAAIQSVAAKLGMTPETLRIWLRRDEVDHHQRPGVTSAERERIRELERENRELRRANEILKAASAFFARELDPRWAIGGGSS